MSIHRYEELTSSVQGGSMLGRTGLSVVVNGILLLI